MKKPKTEYRCLKITCEKDKYDIIMSAIEKFRQKENQPIMSVARALELMLTDKML